MKKTVLFLSIFIISICSIGDSSTLNKDFMDKLDKEINYGYNMALKRYPHITAHQKTYCNGKINVAIAAYMGKEIEGNTLEKTLQIMKDGYLSKPKEERVKRYRYLEYERMTRTIYRHPEQPFGDLVIRFYDDCMHLGF